MNKIFELILKAYYAFFSAFFLFGSFVVLIMLTKISNDTQSYWTVFSLLLYAILFINVFLGIYFKKPNAYLISMYSSVLVLVITTTHRYFFVTNNTLTPVDFNNVLIFLFPIIFSLTIHMKATKQR